MKSFLIAAFSLALPATFVHADNGKTELAESDAKIVVTLHHANQGEIELANYELAHGTRVLKSFAETIIRDHTAADAELVDLAKRHHLNAIPAPRDNQSDRDGLAHLKQAGKGAELDREFINMMVADHADALTALDTALVGVSAPDLRDMILHVRPIIQRHFDTAKHMQRGGQASN